MCFSGVPFGVLSLFFFLFYVWFFDYCIILYEWVPVYSFLVLHSHRCYFTFVFSAFWMYPSAPPLLQACVSFPYVLLILLSLFISLSELFSFSHRDSPHVVVCNVCIVCSITYVRSSVRYTVCVYLVFYDLNFRMSRCVHLLQQR